MTELQNQIKSKTLTILYITIYSFLGFYFGFNISLYNTLINSLMQNYDNPTKEQIGNTQSLINTFFCLGSLLCCFFGSYVFQWLGLYNSVILFSGLNILYDGLSCINNLYFLYAVRFLTGINSVMWTFLGPLMIQKCVFSDLKNKLQNLFYVCLASGCFISNQFTQERLGANYRIAYYVLGAIDVTVFLLLKFKFKMISSEEIIDDLKNLNEEHLLSWLQQNLNYQYDDEVSYQLAQQLLQKNKNKTVAQQQKFNLRKLFSKQNRVQILLVIFLNMLNQITGINIFIQYSNNILVQNKVKNSTLIASLISATNVIAGIVATILSKKLGLKYLLVIGMVIQSFAYQVFLVGMLKTISMCIVIGSIFYMFGFGISLGASFYSYQIQIIEQNSLSFASIFQWIFTILITYFGPKIGSVFDMYYLFAIFQTFAILGAFAVMRYGVQTEGKSFDEIQLEYIRKIK